MTRKPCVTVGYGGPFEISSDGLGAGTKTPWHIVWLPKGYAPTAEDYVICLVAEPPGEDWSNYGLGSKRPRPPLIQAICEVIEAHMAKAPTLADGPLEGHDQTPAKSPG